MKGMGAGLWSFLRAVGTSNGAGQALVVGNRAWAPSLQPMGVGQALAGPWVLGGWCCLGPCKSLAYSVHWGRGLDGWWQTAGSQAKRGPDRHHQPPFTNWLRRKENPIFLSRCFQMAAHWDSASHPRRNQWRSRLGAGRSISHSSGLRRIDDVQRGAKAEWGCESFRPPHLTLDLTLTSWGCLHCPSSLSTSGKFITDKQGCESGGALGWVSD